MCPNLLNEKLTWVNYEETFWELIKKYIKQNDRVVDLGCGKGQLAKKLRDDFNVLNISLVDIVDQRVEEDVKSFPFYKIDLNRETIPLKDSSQDAIFAIQVLEHLENGFHFMRECWRILKDGGVLFLSIPNGYNLFSRIRFLKSATIEGYGKKTDHLSFYPRDILFNRLFAGFELVDKFYRKRLVDYPILNRLKLHYPTIEFFSRKVCYLLKKNISI